MSTGPEPRGPAVFPPVIPLVARFLQEVCFPPSVALVQRGSEASLYSDSQLIFQCFRLVDRHRDESVDPKVQLHDVELAWPTAQGAAAQRACWLHPRGQA